MTKKDFILIENAVFMVKIGVTEKERSAQQKISISLKIYQDFSKVFKSKNLNDSVDYEKVVNQISDYVKIKEWVLVEDLAQDIHKLLKNTFTIKKVDITINKFCLKNVDKVGIFVQF